MSSSNPFNIMLVLTAMMMIVAAIFAVAAPALGIAGPTAPVLPSAPSFSSSTDWLTMIGTTLWFLGEIIVYGLSFFVYMLSVLGSVFSFLTLGFVPTSVGTAIIITVSILFIGSLAMFARGNNGGGK